jgi:hypothetical protein
VTGRREQRLDRFSPPLSGSTSRVTDALSLRLLGVIGGLEHGTPPRTDTEELRRHLVRSAEWGHQGEAAPPWFGLRPALWDLVGQGFLNVGPTVPTEEKPEPGQRIELYITSEGRAVLVPTRPA